MTTPVASKTRHPAKGTEKVSILAGVGYGLTVAVIIVFMINGTISQFS